MGVRLGDAKRPYNLRVGVGKTEEDEVLTSDGPNQNYMHRLSAPIDTSLLCPEDD